MINNIKIVFAIVLIVLLLGCNNRIVELPNTKTLKNNTNNDSGRNNSQVIEVGNLSNQSEEKPRELIRSCPTRAHWDQMPCDGSGCKKSCYYEINGTFWDCSDVDRVWILENCEPFDVGITY